METDQLRLENYRGPKKITVHNNWLLPAAYWNPLLNDIFISTHIRCMDAI